MGIDMVTVDIWEAYLGMQEAITVKSYLFFDSLVTYDTLLKSVALCYYLLIN